MSLPHKFFEPSFRYRRLGTFLALIVGVMVFIATFITAAESALSLATVVWNVGQSNQMTVEIPAIEEEASTDQGDRAKQAIAILEAMPGIGKVHQVPDAEAQKLLQPWIGDGDVLASLPLPTLIDVEKLPGNKLSADDVRLQLKATLRDVRVDDHAAWLADLARFVDGMAAFGILMIGLAAMTLILAVSLVCRTIMATERETISLLHIMGAEDNDIACHFESHTRQLAFSAAVIGFVGAVFSAGILLFFMRHFADPAVLSGMHWGVLLLLIMAVPLAAIFIASLSAKYSVLNALRAMP